MAAWPGFISRTGTGLSSSRSCLDGSFAPAKKGGDKVGLTKKGKGAKWMLVIDGTGVPLGFHLDSAQIAEVRLAERTLDTVSVARPTPLFTTANLRRAALAARCCSIFLASGSVRRRSRCNCCTVRRTLRSRERKALPTQARGRLRPWWRCW